MKTANTLGRDSLANQQTKALLTSAVCLVNNIAGERYA
jgi:hypothetical protein